MCGICGFISRRPISEELLANMNDTMAHRGPDDRGYVVFQNSEYHIGLAQRRLSIFDLSPAGHQPMFTPDCSLAIVFNGEIYNFLELKEELRRAGFDFISHTDTEVILAAYQAWGIDCLNRFNGMFAFALYDFGQQALFLARDRIGKKPLYYYIENDILLFGSELKPLMAYPGFPKVIRKEIIAKYLLHQCINSPDTIFKNTYKLEPGAYLRWHAGQVTTTPYWDLAQRYASLAGSAAVSYDEAKRGLHKILEQAVAYRMLADVPIGTFLSGGYDSSLVTAIAQSISSTPVKTYSIGFTDAHLDEAKYAREIAGYLGTDHHEAYITEADILPLTDEIPRYYDEPFADSSQLPTMLLSRLARQDITVALSGDGGDELFCGYNEYAGIKKYQRLDIIGNILRKGCTLPFIDQLQIIDRLPRKMQLVIKNEQSATKAQLPFQAVYETAAKFIVGSSDALTFPIEDRFPIANWQMRRMLLDMLTYLPGDILAKVDRASMRYSLEVRCPILDYHVIEYSFTLPHIYKYQRGILKRILKDLAYTMLPQVLLDRPKQGFSVPLAKWLSTVLYDRLMAFANKDTLRVQGIFQPDYIHSVIHDLCSDNSTPVLPTHRAAHYLWSFYVFQSWYNMYIKSIY